MRICDWSSGVCSSDLLKPTNPPSYRKAMVRAARSRAKKLGIACTIDHNSFEVPNVCPVLGIPLFRKGSKGYSDNAPSLDRINPALGYVQGNIIVVSMRCKIGRAHV